MIDITLLGTSSLIPLPDRAETAAVLTCGGHTILFDCGEGTQTAARKAGVGLFKTDIIALTHYHGDHVFGLPGLLQTLNMLGRTEKLTILGPGEPEEALCHILGLVGNVNYPVEVMALPEGGLRLWDTHPGFPQGAALCAFPTEHRVTSQGYVFSLDRAGKFLPEKALDLGVPRPLWGILQRGTPVEVDGRRVSPADVLGPARKGLKFVFSGDTAKCDSLAEAAKGADLLFCEATYGENDQADMAAEHGHMIFAQAGEVAAQAQAGELVLMHYSQMIEDPEAYLPNAKAHFENTTCGTDGLHRTLVFEK